MIFCGSSFRHWVLGVQAAEAMNKRLDGVRGDFLIAHSRKDAAQSANPLSGKSISPACHPDPSK